MDDEKKTEFQLHYFMIFDIFYKNYALFMLFTFFSKIYDFYASWEPCWFYHAYYFTRVNINFFPLLSGKKTFIGK